MATSIQLQNQGEESQTILSHVLFGVMRSKYISVGLELIFGIKVSQSGFDSIKNNVVLFEIARQFFFLLLTLTFNLLFTKWS